MKPRVVERALVEDLADKLADARVALKANRARHRQLELDLEDATSDLNLSADACGEAREALVKAASGEAFEAHVVDAAERGQ